MLAVVALAAAVLGFAGDSVAGLEFRHALANLDSGKLMAGKDRGDTERVHSMQGVNLGTAYTAFADADLHIFIISDLRLRHIAAEFRNAQFRKITSSHGICLL